MFYLSLASFHIPGSLSQAISLHHISLHLSLSLYISLSLSLSPPPPHRSLFPVCRQSQQIGFPALAPGGVADGMCLGGLQLSLSEPHGKWSHWGMAQSLFTAQRRGSTMESPQPS